MVYLQIHLHIKSFYWDYFTSSSQRLSEGDKAGILMLEKKKVIVTNFCCCSVPVMSKSLRPHGLKHNRLPCPPLSPGVCSDSCPLSWWYYLTLCRLLLLLSSIFPIIRVFSCESALCIRWPKDWSFSFSISPSNEYSRLMKVGRAKSELKPEASMEP